MGIKAGSGRGSSDVGGSKGNVPGGVGSSSKRGRNKLPPPPPKKPFRPTENPFPEYKGFRLGCYRILEERDNYLLCTGFDPNAKNPASEVTPSAYRTGVLQKIAKPWALQRTIWEAAPVTINGVEYTYVYSNTEKGLRTAYWTDANGDHEEEQRIYVPYTLPTLVTDPPKLGDMLVAVEIRKSAAVDGMNVEDEDGTRLRWMDLNVSGRHWKAEPNGASVIRFTITAVTTTSTPSVDGVATATVNNMSCGGKEEETSVTIYDPLRCLLNETAAALVGRRGFAARMEDPDSSGCRYEITSLCCPDE